MFGSPRVKDHLKSVNRWTIVLHFTALFILQKILSKITKSLERIDEASMAMKRSAEFFLHSNLFNQLFILEQEKSALETKV